MTEWIIRLLSLVAGVAIGVAVCMLLLGREKSVEPEQAPPEAPVVEKHREAINKALDGLGGVEKEMRSRKDEVEQSLEKLVRDGAADIDALLGVLRKDAEVRGSRAADGADKPVR